ncbi:MAG: hypothetical protein AB7I30_17530 [Isosphaeraceae bacterium]
MTEREPELSPEQEAEADALAIGRRVVGRELTVEEAEAMTTIFRSAVQALKHGFIRRLAEHVQAERTDEAVEEFFEEQIHPD